MPLDARQYLGRAGAAREISDGIERAIDAGDLRPGEALPPIRTLAAQLAVNTTTVANAYRQLQARGLTYADRRRGTRVNGSVATAHAPRAHTAGLVDLASGNGDPDLHPDWSAALTASGGAHRTSYGAPATLPEFHRVAAQQLSQDGIGVERLTVVGGALDGIERVLTAHLSAGDRVALEDPCFSRTLDLVRAMNLTPEPVPCDDDGPLPQGLAQALHRGARAVIVTPRAQNPYGAAISASRREDLSRVLRARPDVLLIEDDHAALVADTPPISLTPAWTGPWAVIRSYAKALGPDLRVAVLTGDDTTVSRVERRLRLGTGWVSHLLQGTVASLLAQPSTGQLLHRAQRTYADRRRFVTAALADLGIEAHGRSGFNVWIPLRHEFETVTALREHGYAVLAGEHFRISSGPGIRVTTAALEHQQATGFITTLASLVRRGPRTAIFS